jgi:hypothetical protein
MEDQLNLQFAALNCYKAVAETLPEGLTVESMTFQRGRTLAVSGISDAGSQSAVHDFNDKLRKYTVGGQPLFSRVAAPSFSTRGGLAVWNFQCELNNAEGE